MTTRTLAPRRRLSTLARRRAARRRRRRRGRRNPARRRRERHCRSTRRRRMAPEERIDESPHAACRRYKSAIHASSTATRTTTRSVAALLRASIAGGCCVAAHRGAAAALAAGATSPLSSPELRALLESLKASGAIGSWVRRSTRCTAARLRWRRAPTCCRCRSACCSRALMAARAVRRDAEGRARAVRALPGLAHRRWRRRRRLLLTNPSHLPDGVDANGRPSSCGRFCARWLRPTHRAALWAAHLRAGAGRCTRPAARRPSSRRAPPRSSARRSAPSTSRRCLLRARRWWRCVPSDAPTAQWCRAAVAVELGRADAAAASRRRCACGTSTAAPPGC